MKSEGPINDQERLYISWFERGNHAHFGSAGPLKPCMILDAEKLVL